MLLARTHPLPSVIYTHQAIHNTLNIELAGQFLLVAPDDMGIVSGSHDKTIRVWSMLNSSILMSPTTSTSPIPPTQTMVPSFPTSLSWQLQADGWTVENHMRLLWIPHDLRDRLLVPPNTLFISTRGSVMLNFEHAAFGESWAECYRPSLV